MRMEGEPHKRLKLSIEPVKEDDLLRISKTGEFELESKNSASFSVKVLKVDFSGKNGRNAEGKASPSANPDNNEDASDAGEKSSKTNTSQTSRNKVAETQDWKWQPVLTNLIKAKSEVDITADLLRLIQDKEYMVLDDAFLTMAPFKDARKPSAALRMATKRQQFTSASKILKQSADRLALAVQQDADYFVQTKELQRHWLLKLRKNNDIVLDLSLRSCGSTFSYQGEFPVVKRPIQASASGGRAITFVLPPEISKTKSMFCCLETRRCNHPQRSKPPVMPLTCAPTKQNSAISRLRRTQHFLFSQGLYSHLSQTSTGLTSVPISTSGNAIRMEVDTHTKLLIQLCSSDSKELVNNDLTANGNIPACRNNCMAMNSYNSTMSVILHTLARKEQSLSYLTSHAPPLHHASTTHHSFSPSKEYWTPGSPILSLLFDVIKHVSYCRQVQSKLEAFSAVSSDPTITVHWQSTNCLNTSYATVNLRVADMLLSNDGAEFRSFSLTVHQTHLRVITESGDTYDFSVDELTSFLVTQLATVQMDAMVVSARELGWTLLQKDTSRQCVSSHFSLVIRKGTCVLSIKLIPNTESLYTDVDVDRVSLDPTLSLLPSKVDDMFALCKVAQNSRLFWDTTSNTSLKEKLVLLLLQA
eukprot:CFRG4950T1